MSYDKQLYEAYGYTESDEYTPKPNWKASKREWHKIVDANLPGVRMIGMFPDAYVLVINARVSMSGLKSAARKIGFELLDPDAWHVMAVGQGEMIKVLKPR